MIQKTCDICGAKAKPADSDQQANRNLGMHKWSAHQVRGTANSSRYKQAREAKDPKRVLQKPIAVEGDPVGNRKRYQAWYRATHKNKARRARPVHATVTESEPVPIRLSECPCCGARFWAVKGSQ